MIGGSLLGGALVLGAANGTWASAEGSRGEGLPVEAVALTSYDLARPVAALALLALASVAALVATRGRVRQLVGALSAATGGGITFVAVQARSSAQQVAQAELSGVSNLHVTLAPWSWIAAAGGVLIAAAGLMTVVRSGTWPSMSRRYDARTREPAAPGPDGTHEGLWRSLDRGHDPTED